MEVALAILCGIALLAAGLFSSYIARGNNTKNFLVWMAFAVPIYLFAKTTDTSSNEELWAVMVVLIIGTWYVADKRWSYSSRI